MDNGTMEITSIAAEHILQRARVYGLKKLENVPESVRAIFEPTRYRTGRTRGRTGRPIPFDEDEPILPLFKCPTEPGCPGHTRFCVYCYLGVSNAPTNPRTQPIPCKCPKACPGHARSKSCERARNAGEAGRVRKAEDIPARTPKRSQSQPPFARISSIALPKIPPRSLSFLETCALGYQLNRGWEVVDEPSTAAQHFGFTPPLEHCPDCQEALTFDNLNLENLLRLTDPKGGRSDVPAMPCTDCTLKRRHRAQIKAELVEGYDELVEGLE